MTERARSGARGRARARAFGGALGGVTVVVTRPEAQGRPLAGALAERGATVHCLPTIAIADPADPGPLERAIASLSDYDWLIFTSANGVERFAAQAERAGTALDWSRARVAAIGPATAAAATRRGIPVDLVPDLAVAEGLAESLTAFGPLAGSRVLLARAAVGRDVLPDRLRAAGARVDVVAVYQTTVAEESRAPLVGLAEAGTIDFATFTSSSTATSFVELVGEARARAISAVCAGPITAATARALGLTIAGEIEVYSVAGMIGAIEAAVRKR